MAHWLTHARQFTHRVVTYLKVNAVLDFFRMLLDRDVGVPCARLELPDIRLLPLQHGLQFLHAHQHRTRRLFQTLRQVSRDDFDILTVEMCDKIFHF